MKKLLSALLALSLLFSLCACGDGKQTASAPESSVKTEVAAETPLSFGIYHLNIGFCNNNASDYDSKLEEFKRVVEAGYVNTVIMSTEGLVAEDFWNVIIDNDLTVWLNVWDIYDSSKTNTDDFISKFSTYLEYVKNVPERWERFVGFHFDEPINRGQSNKDYLEMTKALYDKYEKRIFPVFAVSEFTGGNTLDAATMKYTTDVGFYSYKIDVRDDKNTDKQKAELSALQKEFPEITDGKSYYRILNEKLAASFDRDVNMWLFPCGHTIETAGGYRADEAYCTAHLEYFKQLLKEQKCPAGLILYTYQDFSNPDEKGLKHHLDVADETGEQWILPGDERWNDYSKAVKKTVEEFKNETANLSKYKP